MSHRLQVLISPDLDARLEKEARRKRVSKGEWVRQALENALDRSAKHKGTNPLDRLSELNAPTADIDQMLAEIEAGRS